jgi:hypothetical protein
MPQNPKPDAPQSSQNRWTIGEFFNEIGRSATFEAVGTVATAPGREFHPGDINAGGAKCLANLLGRLRIL